MEDKYLREHEFDESLETHVEPGLFWDIQKDKLAKFQEILAASLTTTTVDEKEIVQKVVMAALEADGIDVNNPEVIVESVMVNPEMRAEAVFFAESLMRRNLQ